jgi:uncharacterized protein YciI
MPLFAVWASDRTGVLQARLAAREAHRARLREPGVPGLRVVLAGPLSDAAAGTMNGSMLVIEAGRIEAVREFVAGDPYVAAGVYGPIDIRPWVCGLGPLKNPSP